MAEVEIINHAFNNSKVLKKDTYYLQGNRKKNFILNAKKINRKNQFF